MSLPHRSKVLALDTASPVISVAVATPERTLSRRRSTDATSSRHLLQLVEDCLDDASLSLPDLRGVCALQGPGSFTGLRVGLATVLGFHQALGLRATALPTLVALAASAQAGHVLAVVDALRGHWFHQLFDLSDPLCPRAVSTAVCEPVADLAFDGVDEVVGFGVGSLADIAPARVTLTEPEPLAVAAAGLVGRRDSWEPARLIDPLYLRPPPARGGSAQRSDS